MEKKKSVSEKIPHQVIFPPIAQALCLAHAQIRFADPVRQFTLPQSAQCVSG